MHSGTAPCEKCRKSGIAGCTLTKPHQRPIRRGKSLAVQSNDRQPSPATGPDTRQSNSPFHTTHPSTPFDQETPIPIIEQHLASLSNGVVLKGLNIFTNKFPELAILHIPTFQKDMQSDSQSTRTLLAAMLAVIKQQPILINQNWAANLLSSDTYAKYAKAKLADEIFRPPSIRTVQTLLIMTLYEWGCCGFHQAWVYCGM